MTKLKVAMKWIGETDPKTFTTNKIYTGEISDKNILVVADNNKALRTFDMNVATDKFAPADAPNVTNAMKKKRAAAKSSTAGKAESPKKDRPLLTEKQIQFISHMPDDDFYENGLDSLLWIDIYCDTMEGFGMNNLTSGAMLTTLRQKGVIVISKPVSINGRMAKSFQLTDYGKEVVGQMGLKLQ